MSSPLSNQFVQWGIGATPELPQIIPFTRTIPTDTPFLLDLTLLGVEGKISTQRSVYIDNNNNPAFIKATVPLTGQYVICPAYCAGWFPLFVPNPIRVLFEAFGLRTDVASADVGIAISNLVIADGPNQIRAIEQRIQRLPVSVAASGINQLTPATANANTRVFGGLLSAAADVTISFYSGANLITGPMQILKGVPLVIPFAPAPWLQTNSNEALNLNLSGAVQVGGSLLYELSA